MSVPIPTTISRSSLMLRECPRELADELAYVRRDIAFDAGKFNGTPVTVSYAHYDDRTRVCRTYPNALHLVQKAAKKLGLVLSFTDQRIRPPLDLRPLDRREFEPVRFQVLEAVARTNSSGLIIVPTGADSTSILCGLVRLLPGHFKVLVTADDKTAVDQIHAALMTAAPDEPIGIHNNGVSRPARIIVTQLDALKDFTQGELAYSGHGLRGFDAWICDEVHRLPAPSRLPLLNQFRTVFSWGLTATPERADNSHQLNSVVFGPTLFDAGHHETLETRQRISSEGVIKLFVFPLPSESPIPEGWTLHAKICAAYLKNHKLGLLLKGIDEALPATSKAIIAVETLRLAILLRKALPHYPLVHGKLSPALRQQELDRFRRGDITRLICADLWSGGIDVPDADYLVDCSARFSSNSVLQCMRRAGNKHDCHYLMFLCLASEELFNHGVRKLQAIEKTGWDAQYMFPRSTTETLPFAQAALLPELGTFTEG